MYDYGNEEKDEKDSRKSLMVVLKDKYLKAMKSNPLLTKSITSGVVSASGNLAAQLISIRKGNAAEINFAELARYGSFGFAVTTPIMHYFYMWLERNIPAKSREAMVKRLLVERLVITPGIVVCFHAWMAALEKRNIGAVNERVRMAFWATLVMNWKFWTVLQIINLNYVPRELKVIFGNMCGFVWTIFLAANTKSKKE